MTPGDLNELLDVSSDGIILLDSRDLRSFRRERLPGARFGWWQDTIDPNYPWYGAVLTQGEEQAFRRALLGDLGIEPSQHVVVYDNMQGYRAARWVWFLSFLGFRASLLDGGFSGWKASGLQTESGLARSFSRTNPIVSPVDGFYLVTRQVIDRLSSPEVVIVDTRTTMERGADQRDIPRKGAIPGSIWIPWTQLLNPSQDTIASAEALSQIIEQHDLANASEIIVYARYGVDAALPWLVFTTAGLFQTTIYDRGWIEWSNREDLPYEPLT